MSLITPTINKIQIFQFSQGKNLEFFAKTVKGFKGLLYAVCVDPAHPIVNQKYLVDLANEISESLRLGKRHIIRPLIYDKLLHQFSSEEAAYLQDQGINVIQPHIIGQLHRLELVSRQVTTNLDLSLIGLRKNVLTYDTAYSIFSLLAHALATFRDHKDDRLFSCVTMLKSTGRIMDKWADVIPTTVPEEKQVGYVETVVNVEVVEGTCNFVHVYTKLTYGSVIEIGVNTETLTALENLHKELLNCIYDPKSPVGDCKTCGKLTPNNKLGLASVGGRLVVGADGDEGGLIVG